MSDKFDVLPGGEILSPLSVGRFGSSSILTTVSADSATTGGALIPGNYEYWVLPYTTQGDGTYATATHTVPAGTNTNVATVSWLPVIGAAGYKVYGRTLGYVAAPTLSLAAGGTLEVPEYWYTYSIASVTATGENILAYSANITPTTGNQTVNVGWLPVFGATGYKVYRNRPPDGGGGGGGAFALIATVGSGTLTFIDDGSVTPSGAQSFYNTAYAILLMATIADPNILTWSDTGSIAPSGVPPAWNAAQDVRLAASGGGSSTFGYGSIAQGNILSYGTAFGHQAAGPNGAVSFGYRTAIDGTTPSAYVGASLGSNITTNDRGMAIGDGAYAHAVGLSVGTNASSVQGVSVGYAATSYASHAFGYESEATVGSASFGHNIYSPVFSSGLSNGIIFGENALRTRYSEFTISGDRTAAMKRCISDVQLYGTTNSATTAALRAFSATGDFRVTGLAATTSTTGGTLTPGTYYYRISTGTQFGWTLPSDEVSIVVPAGTNTNVVSLSWDAPLSPDYATYGSAFYVSGRTSGATTFISAPTGNLLLSTSALSITDPGYALSANVVSASDTMSSPVVLANNSALFFTVSVTARDLTEGGLRGWTHRGVVRRWASASATAISSITTSTWSNAAGTADTWDCTISADTTNGAIGVDVTGAAGITILWDAKVSFTEVKI